MQSQAKPRDAEINLKTQLITSS